MSIIIEDEKWKIYSEKVDNARDEYKVICYYGEKAYKETNEKRELEFKGTIEENIANDENTKIEKEIEQKYEVAENISGIVSTKEEAGEVTIGWQRDIYPTRATAVEALKCKDMAQRL